MQEMKIGRVTNKNVMKASNTASWNLTGLPLDGKIRFQEVALKTLLFWLFFFLKLITNQNKTVNKKC